MRALPAVVGALPDEVMRAELVDAQLAWLYDGDARLGKLIGAGGAVALVLAKRCAGRGRVRARRGPCSCI